MSRLAERVAQGLHEIADRATPSSTAWTSIRSRIDAVTEEAEMEIPMLQPNKQKPWRRGRLAAVVIAAAAAIAVGIFALVGPADEAELSLSGPGQQAVDVARRFVGARDAWDAKTVRSLVADDAVIDDFGVVTPDDYIANTEFERATGWRFIEPECTVTEEGPPAEVTCSYTMENAWSRALGTGPYTDNTFAFVIADGQIQQVVDHFDISRYAPETFEAFTEWLDDKHPGDSTVIFHPDPNEPGLVIRSTTAEAIALAEQRTIEFVASVNGS